MTPTNPMLRDLQAALALFEQATRQPGFRSEMLPDWHLYLREHAERLAVQQLHDAGEVGVGALFSIAVPPDPPAQPSAGWKARA